MKNLLAAIIVSLLGLALPLIAQNTLPPQPVPIDPNRLVDGVDLTSFQTIQGILLEVSADDEEIAALDQKMELLREQRAMLTYQVAARVHPELADKLKIMQVKLLERLQAEAAVAREAKLAAKNKR